MKGEPWLRLYTTLVEPDDKSQFLGDRLFRYWILALCAYKRNGEVMPELPVLAKILNVPAAKVPGVLEDLRTAGLFDATPDGLRPHNWHVRQHKGDVSTGRVQVFRERSMKQLGNVSETFLETPTETPPETDVKQLGNVSETFLETPTETDVKQLGNVSETSSDYRLQISSSLIAAAKSELFGRASSQQQQQQRKTIQTEPAKLNAALQLLLEYPRAFHVQWEPPDGATVERILDAFGCDIEALDRWLLRLVRRRHSVGPGDGWGLLVTIALAQARRHAAGGHR